MSFQAQLSGRNKKDCEAALKNGVPPPPGFNIPRKNTTLGSRLSSIDEYRHAEGRDLKIFSKSSVYAFWSAAIAGPILAYGTSRARRILSTAHVETRSASELRSLILTNLSLSLALFNFEIIEPLLDRFRWQKLVSYYDDCAAADVSIEIYTVAEVLLN